MSATAKFHSRDIAYFQDRDRSQGSRSGAVFTKLAVILIQVREQLLS